MEYNYMNVEIFFVRVKDGAISSKCKLFNNWKI